MESTWTITELAERAVEALTTGESVRVNGRVRDLPNERLIRWYTTIGLVDPPLGRRGRTALYGHRHLLQIVAVKRRQSAGRTIAQIQAELSGATDTTLSRMAGLPEGTPAPPRTERDRFWTDRPTPPATPPARTGEGAAPVQGVRLGGGVTVLLETSALSDDDIAAIETAARPLLEELRRRGLAGPAPNADVLPTDAPPGRAQ